MQMQRRQGQASRLAVAVGALALAMGMTTATAGGDGGGADGGAGARGRHVTVQVLSFNDFHGHLESDGGLGGAPAMAGLVDELRDEAGDQGSITVAAGDLIGGSPFASTVFQDEPSIEVMNAMGLDASAVGNHEFDEGVDELMRMQHGGCHPELGCFGGTEYEGADFPYLAANVLDRETGEPILPPVYVERVRGIPIGFIGVVTDDLPILVNPAGIADVEVIDEVEAINTWARWLKRRGVRAIVVVMHEGGEQAGSDPNGCEGLTGPLLEINEGSLATVDLFVTGHSHDGYVCELEDRFGRTRLAVQASDFGKLVTETSLVLNRRRRDVARWKTTAVNHVVTEDGPISDEVQEIADRWVDLAAPLANRVVGSVAEDITGDASGDRGIETPMGALVADSMLWGTSAPQDGGAQIAFMNIGGVRDSFLVDEISAGEAAGEITYGEAAAVMPFSNLLVTMDLTGAQIAELITQQYDETRSRVQLALAVSEGFTYEWDDATRAAVPGSMMLDGVPIDMAATYRVVTLNFLASGGDGFAAFTEGTNVLGGAGDLENFVEYLEANPDLTAPEDRIAGL